jgi:3-oxoacyl-[acyl-carrier protein] reductase
MAGFQMERITRWTKSQVRKLTFRLGYSITRREPVIGQATEFESGKAYQSTRREASGSERLLVDDAALITGAARGIGAAISRAIAREGAKTFLTDTAEEEIRTLAEEIGSAGSGSAFLAADLRDPASYDKIFEAATGRFGPMSIFVHAASPRSHVSVLELDDLTGNENVVVNLEAGYQIAKRMARKMVQDRTKGRMLFITSLHARMPGGNPAYSAAKAGLTLIMKEFAKTLGPHGIRVNAIAPGVIVENQSMRADRTPLRRKGRPEEVASIAVALLADQYSSYVTGTTITVDGGLSLYNWQDL